MPADSRLAQAVQRLLLEQARELRLRVTPDFVRSGKRVHLGHWSADEQIDALVPFLLRDWQAGIKDSAARLLRQGRPVDTRMLRTEMVHEAREQVRRMLRETAKVTANAVNAAVREARGKLRKGSTGSLLPVHAAIQQQLQNSTRAAAIAAHETEAAKNGGRLLVIGESGAKGKRWVTKFGPTCCDLCKSLHGKVVKVGQPFHVDPKGGPYAVKDAPPAHPHCVCECVASIRGPR